MSDVTRHKVMATDRGKAGVCEVVLASDYDALAAELDAVRAVQVGLVAQRDRLAAELAKIKATTTSK